MQDNRDFDDELSRQVIEDQMKDLIDDHVRIMNLSQILSQADQARRKYNDANVTFQVHQANRFTENEKSEAKEKLEEVNKVFNHTFNLDISKEAIKQVDKRLDAEIKRNNDSYKKLNLKKSDRPLFAEAVTAHFELSRAQKDFQAAQSSGDQAKLGKAQARLSECQAEYNQALKTLSESSQASKNKSKMNTVLTKGAHGLFSPATRSPGKEAEEMALKNDHGKYRKK